MVPFLVVEDGEVDGARDVVDFEFRRRANVDHLRKFLKVERRCDALGKIHELRI